MESTFHDWIRTVTGRQVRGAERSLGGGSKELWIVELEDAALVVLRVEPGRPGETSLSLDREARVYRALAETPVRIPELLASRPDALLIEWVDGVSRPAQLTEEVTTASFMAALAELHALEVPTLDLPGFAVPERAADHALADLERWEALVLGDDPLVAYALGWLGANAPPRVQRTVLVHGDAGPGNFLVRDHEVVALVDWEFAHFGDPMDDIAWCDLRASGAPAFQSWRTRDRHYEQASGLVVDADAVAYYAVLVRLRCAITTAVTVASGRGALGLAGYQKAHAGFLVGLGKALGAVVGVQSEGQSLPAEPTSPRSGSYARAVDRIESGVLPKLTDSSARLAAREAAALVDHLGRVDRYGAELERQDRAEQPGDLMTTSRAAGRQADPARLAYLQRRAGRHGLLWGIDDVPAPTDRSGDD